MLFTVQEILDIVIMSLAVGFIFMKYFSISRLGIGSPEYYMKKRGFDWDSFKLSILIVAPGIILHELGHKFVALGFGFNAVFHAAYTFLGIGVALSLMNFPFIFFVPAYVRFGCIAGTTCQITHLQSAIIAAAGPLTNLLIAIIAIIVLKFYSKGLKKKTITILHMTKVVNLFLFVFNMLPFLFFDGYKVFSGFFNAFF